MLNRAVKNRFALILLLGLGASYILALRLKLVPSIGDLLTLRTPIVCPADLKYHAPPPAFLNADQSIAQLLPNGFDRNKITVFIEKSQYRLTIYYDQKPIKSYKVVFGGAPQGDKRREGDLKTPEGILKIQDKYPHPDWSRFLWLDYPNTESECKHKRAKQTGEIPWNSTIGGEVGIHGVPKLRDRLIDDRNNWTWGCPSLKTNDINELYEVVEIGTIVEIVA